MIINNNLKYSFICIHNRLIIINIINMSIWEYMHINIWGCSVFLVFLIFVHTIIDKYISFNTILSFNFSFNIINNIIEYII